MPPPLSETFTSPSERDLDRLPRRRGARNLPRSRGRRPPGPISRIRPGDIMYDGSLTDHLFIPWPPSPSPARPAASGRPTPSPRTGAPSTQPVTIDGASGLVGVECNVAAVTIDGRGYLVVFYTSGDEPYRRGLRPGLVRAASDDDPPPPGGRRRRVAIARRLGQIRQADALLDHEIAAPARTDWPPLTGRPVFVCLNVSTGRVNRTR